MKSYKSVNNSTTTGDRELAQIWNLQNFIIFNVFFLNFKNNQIYLITFDTNILC